jgi:hypothetical protein
MAVFVAPMAVPPSSVLLDWMQDNSVWGGFRRYLDLAYINHGYGFFSPDPGSSMVIHYRLEMPDGDVIEGKMPDLDEHWPRLRYHRHFMLTSQANMLPELPQAYVVYLQRKHGAKRVSLEYLEHMPATPEQILEGRKLDDPRSYRVVGTATINEAGKVDVQVIEPQPEALPAADPMGTPAEAQL